MDEKIQIILEAVEQAKAQIDQAINDINRLNRTNEDSAKVNAKVKQSLRDQTSELISTTIQTLALYEAIRKVVEVSISLPAELERMAQAAGTNVETFSTLSTAANKYELDTHQLGIALKNLSVATAQALQGDARRIAQFKALGISTEFLRTHQNDLLGILFKVSDAFKDHADGVNKADLAQVLFGRSSQQLISFLNQGSESIKNQQEELAKLGVITTQDAERSHEFHSALVEFKAANEAAARGVVQSMLPALTDLLHNLVKAPQALKDAEIGIVAVGAAALIATQRINPYVAALGGLLSILTLLNESYELGKAKGIESNTEANLKAQRARFQQQINDNIETLNLAGKITNDKAGELYKEVYYALNAPADAVNARLQRIRNELRAIQGLQPLIANSIKPPTAEKAQLPGVGNPKDVAGAAADELAVIKAHDALKLAEAKKDFDEQQRLLNQALDQRMISVEEWQDKSLKVQHEYRLTETKEATAEYKAMAAAISKERSQTNDVAQRKKLDAQLVIAAAELQTKLVQLSKDGSDKRFEIERTAEEKNRQVVTQMIGEARALQGQARERFDQAINEVSFGEKRGEFLNVYKSLDQAEANYIKQLQAEKSALVSILQTIEQINKAHPGTFSQDYIKNVQRLAAENQKTQIQSQREIADKEQQIRANQLQGVQTMFGNMATAAKAFGKEGFIAYKTFAIAQATIDTAKAAIAAYQSVVGIPYVGPVLAPIAAGAAVAAGAAQIATIEAQKYAAGGLIRGGGTATSDSIPIMASDGEYMIDASTVQKVGAERMAMFHESLKRNGVSFHAAGGLVSATQSRAHYAGGGLIERGGGAKGGMNVTLKAAFVETRNQFREFIRKEGTGIVIDGMAERGNQVFA